MIVNLTDRKIKSLKAQDKKYKTWDIAVSGLYLMTMPSGYKVFKLAYRIGKYQKESTLGQYPILSLQAARKQALKAIKLKHFPTYNEMPMAQRINKRVF